MSSTLSEILSFLRLAPALYRNAEGAPPEVLVPAPVDAPPPMVTTTEEQYNMPPAPEPAKMRPRTVAAPQAPAQSEPLPAGPSAPTVTGGVAAQARPAEGGLGDSPFQITPQAQNAFDRLAAFGAAMAGSRSPYFGQALAEGVQGMLRQRQQQTQEARQQQQVDVEQEYRRAVVENQRAELEFQRDPDNPLNQLRVAQTQAALADAQYRLASARNVGVGDSRDRVVERRIAEDGNLYLIHESGRTTRVGGEGGPSFLDRTVTPQARAWLDYQNRRAQAISQAAQLPSPTMRDQALQFWDRNNPAPPNPFTGSRDAGTTAAPTQQPSRVIDLNPPR